MQELLILGCVALFVALVALGLAYARLQRRIHRLQPVANRNNELELRVRDLETQNRFFGKLIQDYLGFMRELYRVHTLRSIPRLLLKFMVWLFEPTEAVVLIRRKPAVADGEREHQLIVAASGGSLVRKGTVLPLSKGPLGQVAMTGVPLERSGSFDSSELPGFTPDLAVPLAIDDDVLGVLALMEPRQQRPHARQLLQLFAQSATLAYKSATTLNRIRSAADLDPLTGVLNRGAVMTLLEEFAKESLSTGQPLSVFLFDIDHFKNYNDNNGHLPGDDCLQLLARIVSDQTRADDAFGRYGGEEFLLLLPGRGTDDAEFVAEKVRSSIADYPFPFEEQQPLGSITVSGGIACLPDHASSVADALMIADKALYEAKAAGRNRVVIPEPPREDSAAAELPALPEDPDDLQRIKGIGARFADGFREIGVFSFRQIAELDWRGIARLADHLKTSPERILRDEWLGQARQLHREKYGEDLERES